MGVINAFTGAGTVTFNGVSSASLGIYVEHYPIHTYPERDYNVVHVPGRGGDIVIDTGSYQNVDRDYDLVIASDTPNGFYGVAASLSSWLHQGSGYLRLSDSYEPDVYRLAYYKENHSISNIMNQAGRATVTFVCKPQCFLTSGELAMTLTSAGTDSATNLPIKSITMTNPTPFPAKPLISIKWSNSTGVGIVEVGSQRLTILSHNNGTYLIDCENEDMYSSTGANLNGSLQMDAASSNFPVIPGGATVTIRVIGNTGSAVTVTPRWWRV